MDERGFTLIELLTVMLIVAALAAIALPMFLGQAHKARDANVKADTLFRIDRSPSGTSRTCTHPGAGGCWDDSSW